MKELFQATKHVGSLLSFLRNPASLEGPLVMEIKKSISDLFPARLSRGQPLHCFLNLVAHPLSSGLLRGRRSAGRGEGDGAAGLSAGRSAETLHLRPPRPPRSRTKRGQELRRQSPLFCAFSSLSRNANASRADCSVTSGSYVTSFQPSCGSSGQSQMCVAGYIL
jgi:hypothetical protein